MTSWGAILKEVDFLTDGAKISFKSMERNELQQHCAQSYSSKRVILH